MAAALELHLHPVRFESQQHHKWSNVGCGVACLYMLLDHHCREREMPSYDQLARQLRVDKTPHDKRYDWYATDSGKGVYVEDVARWLAQRRFRFAVSSNVRLLGMDGLLKRLRSSPVMVGVYDNGPWRQGHWLVITGAGTRNLSVIDPSYARQSQGTYPMDRRKFERLWDGCSVAILGTY